MLILTGMAELNDITILLEVAGFPEAQEAFDVRTQVILSLFAGT